MGAFQSVPDDVLTAKLSPYLIGVPIVSLEPEQLLVVRETCKSGRDLVQLTFNNTALHMPVNFKPPPEPDGLYPAEPLEMRVSAQVVEAMGRVFGLACTALYTCGRSPERIAALERFVSRASRLSVLVLYDAAVSEEVLLGMCRESPMLEILRGPRYMETSDETIRAISIACPHLQNVSFSRLGRDSGDLSPVESHARLFPQLRDFELHGGEWIGIHGHQYTPTHVEAIRECALNSKAIDLELEGCHITADVIRAIVGTPLGDRIHSLGFIEPDDDNTYPRGTIIEPDAFLAAAHGFPKLRNLCVPMGSSTAGPGFYIDLSRATSRIINLEICDLDTTDACVAAACAHLRLVRLTLTLLVDLTSSIVEGISAGRSARTLKGLCIRDSAIETDSPLRAADMLRLAQGCPNLYDLTWYIGEAHQARAELDDAPCEAIMELMESRGGDVLCYAGGRTYPEFEPPEPGCIFD